MGCGGSKDVLRDGPEALIEEFKNISQELEVEKMMERTIDAILKMMPVQRASVFLVDRSSGVLRSFNTMPVAGDMRGTLRGGMRMEQLTIPMNTGIAGAVVNSARSEIVPEAHKDSRYNRSIESQTGFQTNNIITVPVLLKQSMMEERSMSPGNPRIRSLTGALSAHARQSQQVVAVLQALNHDTSFTASDTSLLEALASLLSGVLARSALVDAAVREKNRASALLKCAEVIFGSGHSRFKAMHVMQAVNMGLRCERSSMILVDEVHSQQVIVSLEESAAGLRIPLSAGASGAVIETGSRIRIADAYSDARFDRQADTLTGYKTRDILAVPVFRRGATPPQVMGVLEALNSRTGFVDSDEALLASMALQVADRLLPELLQDMVETQAHDHELDDDEFDAFKSLLMAEFAPSPKKRLQSAAKKINSILELGTQVGSVAQMTIASIGVRQDALQSSGDLLRAPPPGNTMPRVGSPQKAKSTPMGGSGAVAAAAQAGASAPGGPQQQKQKQQQQQADGELVGSATDSLAAAGPSAGSSAGSSAEASAPTAENMTLEVGTASPDGGGSRPPSSSRSWLGALFGHTVTNGGAKMSSADSLAPGGWEWLPVLSTSQLSVLPRGMHHSDLLSWDTDTLQMEPTELVQLAALVFRDAGVLDEFRIPSSTLGNFLAAVGGKYHPNPYHNFAHGVHVLLSAWLLVKEELQGAPDAHHLAEESATRHTFVTSRSRSTESLSPLHILALLTAAIGHDVDHPGVNNAFLVNTGAPLALRYNDASVLEAHHSATSFAILSNKKCDILGSLRDGQRGEVRKLMIQAILHTDMAHHNTMVKQLTQHAAEHTSDVSASFSLQVLCHVADLCNCAIRWELSKAWAVRVCEEAINQATRESGLGMHVDKLTPYTDDELMARQLVFLDGWIRPLFKAAAILYPGAKARLPAIRECREACKASIHETHVHRRSRQTHSFKNDVTPEAGKSGEDANSA